MHNIIICLAFVLLAGVAQFVQSFYDWYVFKSSDGGDTKGLATALKQRKQLFDAPLYKALAADEAAAAKSPGEIVGLDFDPFVAANGLVYEKYQVGTAVKKGANYLVPVYGIEKGKRTPKVVVEAEVRSADGKTVFTNFHYGKTDMPANENLVSVLNELSKQRVKFPAGK